ncbi:phage head closure protein [Neobacillus sp. WH10]|uniref:phage head closure protein n=1 Tax=Neobacillus sp. WH10 TaxID=3047873 RepID=UPI0024C1CD53|nr:phage head closure protein [Neobacillus sp. WH10]WHY80153.1 phage head closure protein [Neobacillus sp. WH10]
MPRMANQFNHRITFQSFSETENALGDIVKSWVDVKTAWAMVKTVQGREFIQAAAVQAESTVRFVIRYTTGINSDMRIIYKGRIFEITVPPINDDELNKTLTIIGKEVV